MTIQPSPQIDKSENDSHAQSSFGDTSLSVTPKDVNERDASAQDMTERDLQSDEPDQKQQDLLDEAIDLSFPASDPSAIASGRARITVPKSTTNP
jgi:hypothetical protein